MATRGISNRFGIVVVAAFKSFSLINCKFKEERSQYSKVLTWSQHILGLLVSLAIMCLDLVHPGKVKGNA